MAKPKCLSKADSTAVGISAGLTTVANVAIATGPALLGTPRSSVINPIYYIIYKNLFNLRSQYLLNLP